MESFESITVTWAKQKSSVLDITVYGKELAPTMVESIHGMIGEETVIGINFMVMKFLGKKANTFCVDR